MPDEPQFNTITIIDPDISVASLPGNPRINPLGDGVLVNLVWTFAISR